MTAAKKKSVLSAWALRLVALFIVCAASAGVTWAKSDVGPKTAPGNFFVQPPKSVWKTAAQSVETQWAIGIATNKTAVECCLAPKAGPAIAGIVKGETNCVPLALKFDARLGGVRTPNLTGVAAENATLPQVERLLGQRFTGAGSIDEVTAALQSAGPGSRALVVGYRSDAAAHMFNGVVNESGVVKLWNHQAGAFQNTSIFDAGFDFTITTGVR